MRGSIIVIVGILSLSVATQLIAGPDAYDAHEANVQAIASARNDSARDRALKDAIQSLQSPESRVGSWIKPNEYLRERYSDFLNAFAYSEFIEAASGATDAKNKKTYAQAKARVTGAVNHVYSEYGGQFLTTWDHSEVIQTRSSTDDVFRLMVDRLANEAPRFPRPFALKSATSTLGNIHVIMQRESTSVVATEILTKINHSGVFDQSTRDAADNTLKETRSTFGRFFGACSTVFRKIGGG